MKAVFAGLLSTIFISLLPATAIAADTYKFDPDHTSVTWQVSHFGFSAVTGKFMADGTLVVDKAKPENSTVDVIIHTANLVTAIPKLDDMLKGRNFFNVTEFPTATFKSSKVVVTGKNTGKVTGTLTLRGIAKEVVLDVKLNQQARHPFYNKDALGFSAAATIKRSDFGMSGYLPGVGDETKLEIQAEAIVDTH